MRNPPDFLYEFGDYRLEVAEARLLRNGTPVPLPPRTFEVLTLLVRRSGTLVDRDTLMRELWPDSFVEEANIARHIWTLRQAFGGDRYIETVPKRGYRFTPAVRAMAVPAPPPSARGTTLRVMVLPFRMLNPDSDFEFLSFSLADAVAASLGAVDAAIVRSTLVAARFAAESPDLARIAAEAGVDRVIAGTILRSDDRVRVTAQLLAAPDGTLLATAGSEATLGDLFRLQDHLVSQLVAALAPPLAGERRAMHPDVPGHTGAYELYLRANRLAHRPADYQQALSLYQACVAADPGYAPAWARLGRLYRVLAKYGDAPDLRLQQAEEALHRALALNPELSIAHTQSASLEVDSGRAVEAMTRLIEHAKQARHDAELLVGLVHACRYSGLLDASIAAHQHAIALDPLVPTSVVQAYWMRGDVALALAESAKLAGGSLRAMVLALAGREAEAIADLRDQEARMPHAVMRHYSVALRALLEGDAGGCVAAIDELMARGPRDPEGYYFFARYLAKLGDIARANEMLASALVGGFNACRGMEWDPWLAPLRSSPRFAAISREATARYRRAVSAFTRAGGEDVLGAGTAH